MDVNFPFGQRVLSLRQAYNGNQKYPIEKEEKKLAEELGLVEVGTQKSAVAETLEVARILKDTYFLCKI